MTDLSVNNNLLNAQNISSKEVINHSTQSSTPIQSTTKEEEKHLSDEQKWLLGLGSVATLAVVAYLIKKGRGKQAADKLKKAGEDISSGVGNSAPKPSGKAPKPNASTSGATNPPSGGQKPPVGEISKPVGGEQSIPPKQSSVEGENPVGAQPPLTKEQIEKARLKAKADENLKKHLTPFEDITFNVPDINIYNAGTDIRNAYTRMDDNILISHCWGYRAFPARDKNGALFTGKVRLPDGHIARYKAGKIQMDYIPSVIKKPQNVATCYDLHAELVPGAKGRELGDGWRGKLFADKDVIMKDKNGKLYTGYYDADGFGKCFHFIKDGKIIFNFVESPSDSLFNKRYTPQGEHLKMFFGDWFIKANPKTKNGFFRPINNFEARKVHWNAGKRVETYHFDNGDLTWKIDKNGYLVEQHSVCNKGKDKIETIVTYKPNSAELLKGEQYIVDKNGNKTSSLIYDCSDEQNYTFNRSGKYIPRGSSVTSYTGTTKDILKETGNPTVIQDFYALISNITKDNIVWRPNV